MEPIVAYIGNAGIYLNTDRIGGPLDKLAPRPPGKAPVKKRVAPAVKKDPVLSRALAAGKLVYSALRQVGVSDPAATFGMYAAYHETNAFSSPLFINHNNASGIKFAGQKGAVKIANGYAGFPNGLLDWAIAYKHEITKGANAAGARTIEDFAGRLKANGYYQDTPANYIHGMQRARLVLRTMPAAQWDYNETRNYNPDTGISTDKEQSSFKKWMEDLERWAKEHPIGAGLIVAGSAVVISKVLK